MVLIEVMGENSGLTPYFSSVTADVQVSFLQNFQQKKKKTRKLTLRLQRSATDCESCLKLCVHVFLSSQHFQTMLKTKLNVLTLRKEPLPTVIFHEPEAIELCSTTPLAKSRTHAGYKVGSHEPSNP